MAPFSPSFVPLAHRLAALARLPAFALGLVLFGTQLAAGQQKQRDELVDLAKLVKAIDRADEVVVYDTRVKGMDRRVYTSTDPRDLAELKAAIRIDPPDQWFRCACWASATVGLFRHNRKIGEIGAFSGLTIRFPGWSSDARIRDPEPWLTWFDHHGMPGLREEYEREVATLEKDRADEARWMSAMPSSLRPLWAKTLDTPDPTRFDSKPLEAPLAREFPDTHKRILALLSWFGSGAGPWSGFPAYETVAEHMLLQYSISDLLAAVQEGTLTEEQTEGAARLFAGWDFNRLRPDDNGLIPAGLKRTLLEHSLKSSDEDKLARARRAFEQPTR